MTLWSRLRSWLSATVGRSRMESEMDAELRFHIEAFAEDFLNPLPPDDRRAARQEICELLQPILRDETGLWIADYVRLRFRARLPAAPK